MKKSSVYDCEVRELPRIHHPSGNLTPITGEQEVPFAVQRVYYMYDIPGGETRGSHAHKDLYQLMVAASGSFDVRLDDGRVSRTFHLSRPHIGLYMPPGLWRTLDNFSSGAICLVLASRPYSERDYIREYQSFLHYKFLDFVPYSRQFLDLSWQWLNDPEIKRLTMTPDFTREQQEAFFTGLPKREDYFITGMSYRNEPIGACGLRRIDREKSEAEYFAYIGDKSLWSKRLGVPIFQFVLAAAQERGLRTVYTLMNPENERSINFFKGNGFEWVGEQENGAIRMDYHLDAS